MVCGGKYSPGLRIMFLLSPLFYALKQIAVLHDPRIRMIKISHSSG